MNIITIIKGVINNLLPERLIVKPLRTDIFKEVRSTVENLDMLNDSDRLFVNEKLNAIDKGVERYNRIGKLYKDKPFIVRSKIRQEQLKELLAEIRTLKAFVEEKTQIDK